MIALTLAAGPSWAGELFADEERLDDVDLEIHRRREGPDEVPHRSLGLTVTGGGVTVQTPLSGDLAVTFDLRPEPGLRIDLELGSWLGTAYLPGTPHVIPVAVPRIGAAVVYEAPTTGASRPWIGAGVAIAEAMSEPLAVGPTPTMRAGVDIGRSVFAWRVGAYGGVLICPALPAFAGPRYRAVAPVFGVQTGPSVRL